MALLNYSPRKEFRAVLQHSSLLTCPDRIVTVFEIFNSGRHFSVLFLYDRVLAEGDNEIKRGVYPYMAFLYYPEESVVEPSGARFVRGAVLVKPDWLITSSVGPITINDIPLGFPRKTLLARLGAITIDYKFTLSEDEDEQERERRVSNWTAERQLMQHFVELQPPLSQDCGSHYYPDTMLCATDNAEYKSLVNDSEFCQGNSGGPLVCDNEVTGIQTYIDSNCKQPHLYQDLSAWDNFIICGIENKCNEEECSNMCTVMNKDDDAKKYETTSDDPQTTIESTSLFTLTEKITMPSPTSESLSFDDVFVVSTSSVATTQTTVQVTTEKSPTTTLATTKTEPVTDQTQQTSWPKEKYPQREKMVEGDDKIERTTSVEAQRQDVKVKVKKSGAPRNICYFQSLFSAFLFICLM
ncbi:unnamed protein product [Diatraea saccharalis]|uniref:Peptidase S1 domain-containing protein n=1 Tax=Diatraea saccharalis TaxID=40085 RepID=A0A9N9WGN4_9NEOP|nr:unnamed protein product [Diatraea saccharalis]